MENFIERKIKQFIAEEKYTRSGMKFAFGNYKLFLSIDCSKMDMYDKNMNRFTMKQLLPRVERKLVDLFKKRYEFQHFNMLTEELLYSDHIYKAEFIYGRNKQHEYSTITIKQPNIDMHIKSPDRFTVLSKDYNGTYTATYSHNYKEKYNDFIEEVIKGRSVENEIILIDEKSVEEIVGEKALKEFMSINESKLLKKHLKLSDEKILLKNRENNCTSGFLEYVVVWIKTD